MADDPTTKRNAEIIATAIMATKSEYRGNLFKEVSLCLHKKTQYYTANTLAMAAEHYGVNK